MSIIAVINVGLALIVSLIPSDNKGGVEQGAKDLSFIDWKTYIVLLTWPKLGL